MKRNILITGGATGIGRAIALKMADLGYNIFFIYYKSHNLARSLCEELSSKKIMFNSYKCDIRSRENIEKVILDINQKYGGVDILINNSGISKQLLLTETSLDDYNEIMDTNLKSAYFLSKLVIPKMVNQKWGKIINISSIWGGNGAAMESVYCASKFALNGMTKALAKELGSANINVNGVAPGLIDTNMNACLSMDEKSAIIDNIPLGRIGKVEDIANLVCFLASDEASYITGQIITIDGGMT